VLQDPHPWSRAISQLNTRRATFGRRVELHARAVPAESGLVGAWDFRRLTRDDFPLLSEWLSQPEVERWWMHEWSEEALERDFGPSIDGSEPNEDWIALHHGYPVGLVQRSLVADYEENLRDFRLLGNVPKGTATLDYLLGEARGQGTGSAMLAAIVERTWRDLPESPAILVSVVAANTASWRALEEVGFRRVGAGACAPENPIDDPLHYLMRMDRPSKDAAADSRASRPVDPTSCADSLAVELSPHRLPGSLAGSLPHERTPAHSLRPEVACPMVWLSAPRIPLHTPILPIPTLWGGGRLDPPGVDEGPEHWAKGVR
jgi:aminoglycoside 6'-N-acetyltransferase